MPAPSRSLQLLVLTSLLAALLPAADPLTSQRVTLYTKEETLTGVEIGNLRARFSYPEGSTFVMVLPGPEIERLFDLDSRTGVLRTRARLDREALCPSKPQECDRSFNVEVKRSDTGAEENIAVRLVINDINDQRPRFEASNRQFTIGISESDTLSSLYSLPIAEDKDSDSFNALKYKIKPLDDAGAHFKLIMEKRGSTEVPKLELIKPLDREAKDSYKIQLVVSDVQYSDEKDTMDIIIKVLDANDNKPRWLLAQRSIAISECAGLHLPVLKLDATDADLNERIKYYIGRTAGKEVAQSFYIRGQYLMQNRSLDYETIRKKVLYVPLVAEDRGGLKSEFDVELRVTDCNDHYPNITVQLINDSIVENDEGEKTLTRILVRDEDEGNNGTIDCVVGEKYRHKFHLAEKLVDGQHQTMYKLTKLAHVKFDREATSLGEISVEIICADKGPRPLVSTKKVKIKILDVNDNSPVMEHHSYKFRIRENSAPNTLLGRVTARDADSKENARLTFTLDNEGMRFFVVRGVGKRADIYTAVSFDREQKDSYRFVLTAIDGGKEPKSATANVEVTIDDEDDSAPVFKLKDYSFSMVEDYDRNVSRRLIGQVEATDDDIEGNRVVWYEVNRQYQSHLTASGMSGVYFYFNHSYLYGDGNFDREKQESISLEIFARNRGPADHRGAAHVTVTLLDVNDHAPVISGLRKVYNLSESSPAGTQVLQVRGSDKDAGKNGTLTYSLEGTDFGHFSVDASHGIVTLVSSLKDKPAARTYKLNLRARDGGRPPQYSDHYSTFVHVSSGEARSHRTDAKPAGNGGKVRRGAEPHDQNVLILFCLAAVVFVVFVALLVILLYVHARGRRSARNHANHPDVWYDKANGDMLEDPSEATEAGGGGVYRFAIADPATLATKSGLVINNDAAVAASRAAGRSPAAGTLLRNKYPSFDHIPASIDKHRGATGESCSSGSGNSHQAHQRSYYETYGKTSDRLPRRGNLQQHQQPRADEDRAKEYSNPMRVEENRYADRQQQHGYAMLTEAAAGTPAHRQEAGGTTATVCRTPYVTSSFV